jgi:hypothetical protein
LALANNKACQSGEAFAAPTIDSENTNRPMAFASKNRVRGVLRFLVKIA